MTEFPWREVETVAGPVADASAALASALPWWRADAGARLVLERLGAGQVVVEVVAVAGSAVGSDAVAPAGGDAVAPGQDAEVLLLEAAGGGVVAGLWLDPVFTQLLVARLLGDAEPELPAPRRLGPGERGLARYLGAAALDALGASWLAGEVVTADAALALLAASRAGTVAVDILVTQPGATPVTAPEPVSVTAATVATPSPQSPASPDAPATRVAIRVRAPQHPTPTATRAATAVSATPAAARPATARGRYRLLLSPAAMSALATSAPSAPLTPRALSRLEQLPIGFRASAGVATLSPPDLAALAIGDVVVLDRRRGGLHTGRRHLPATLTTPTAAPAPGSGSDTLTLTMSAPPPLAEVHPLMPTEPVAQLTDLPIELTAELGRITLSARAALDLAPGAIVRLGRPPGPITLTAQGKPIAHGELVLIDGELGLRITSL